MMNFYRLNHRLQQMTLKILQNLCYRHDIVIEDGDLKIILHLIQDNPHTVLNDEYTPILLSEISQKTRRETCLNFKPLLDENYLLQEIE